MRNVLMKKVILSRLCNGQTDQDDWTGGENSWYFIKTDPVPSLSLPYLSTWHPTLPQLESRKWFLISPFPVAVPKSKSICNYCPLYLQNTSQSLPIKLHPHCLHSFLTYLAFLQSISYKLQERSPQSGNQVMVLHGADAFSGYPVEGCNIHPHVASAFHLWWCPQHTVLPSVHNMCKYYAKLITSSTLPFLFPLTVPVCLYIFAWLDVIHPSGLNSNVSSEKISLATLYRGIPPSSTVFLFIFMVLIVICSYLV